MNSVSRNRIIRLNSAIPDQLLYTKYHKPLQCSGETAKELSYQYHIEWIPLCRTHAFRRHWLSTWETCGEAGDGTSSENSSCVCTRIHALHIKSNYAKTLIQGVSGDVSIFILNYLRYKCLIWTEKSGQYKSWDVFHEPELLLVLGRLTEILMVCRYSDPVLSSSVNFPPFSTFRAAASLSAMRLSDLNFPHFSLTSFLLPGAIFNYTLLLRICQWTICCLLPLFIWSYCGWSPLFHFISLYIFRNIDLLSLPSAKVYNLDSVANCKRMGIYPKTITPATTWWKHF